MKSVKRISIVLGLILLVIGTILRNPILPSFSSIELIETASAIKLKEYVETIVKVRPYRKYSNIDSLNKVAKYIFDEFEKNCEQVKYQKFQVGDNEYKNVICHFSGKNKKRIVIGAHYDVCQDQDGADDNASGVAGIIELSRLIKANKSNLIHDLEIVAYTLEEPPYFFTDEMGSNIHAKNLIEEKVDVAFMVSVEMIGYFNEGFWSQSYPAPILYAFYPVRGNFITLIGGIKEYWQTRKLKKSLTQLMETPLYSLNAPDVVPGIDFSDHLNYWRYNLNGYMITDTSFYRNKNYHKTSDTIDTLDFDKMSDIVHGIYGLVISDYN